MKIGLITPHYPPDLTGASEFVAHSQARELTSRGHEVRVVAGCSWEHSGRDVLRGRIDDAVVSYLPRLAEETARTDLYRPRWTRVALNELRGMDVCLVHHGATLSSDLIQALSRRLPVVACVSDDIETDALGQDLGSADHVLAASVEVERNLLASVPELVTRLEVRHSGLCRVLSPSQTSQRRAPWDGERPVSLFHFGRRSRLSGLDCLMEGLLELPEGRFELVLAGEEGESGFDSRLASRADSLPIHFFGPYQTSQLETLASACDLAVFPAGTERGHGIVIDEALALGLPVWCSEEADPLGRIRPTADLPTEAGRGTLKRVESRPGRILPAESPTAWTRAFEELLEDPEQLHAERHAIPSTFETTKDTVDRLELLFSGLLSDAFRKAS